MSWRSVVVAITVAVLAAACGGDDASSGGPLATAPAAGGAATVTSSATLGGTGSASAVGLIADGAQLTVLAPLGLNLRSGPSTDAGVIGNLGVGATVTVLGHEMGWYHVKGQTREGFVTDDPRLVSGRHFNRFTSTTKGFGLLYPDTWTFTEGSSEVRLQPQATAAQGPLMTVLVGPTLDALGPPGRPGYGVASLDTVEVYGVTGTERILDRGAAAPAGTTAPLASASAAPAPGAPSPPGGSVAHLLEIRLAVTATYAMRIVVDFNTKDELAVVRDMIGSMTIAAANSTPSPSASAAPASSPPSPN